MTDDDMRLRKAFGFTQDDINANRNGHLTERQLLELGDLYRGNIIFTVVIILVLVFLAFYVLTVEFSLTGFTIVLCLLVLGFLAVVWIDPQKWRNARRSNSVAILCGQIRLSIVRYGRYKATVCRLRIKDQKFEIERRQLLALRDYGTYCIYYVPNSRHILSIEAQ